MIFGREVEHPGLAGTVEPGTPYAQPPAPAFLDVGSKHLGIALLESQGQARAHDASAIDRVNKRLRA